MEPKELAKLALIRLPKPYTNEVALHVFCEIERTPRLRQLYDEMLARAKTQASLNSQISKAVKATLRATKDGNIETQGACEITDSPSRFVDIHSDWQNG